MVSTKQTLAQIKSQEFISYIKQHFKNMSSHICHKDFVKCYIKRWVHLQRDNMQFGRLQPLMKKSIFLTVRISRVPV